MYAQGLFHSQISAFTSFNQPDKKHLHPALLPRRKKPSRRQPDNRTVNLKNFCAFAPKSPCRPKDGTSHYRRANRPKFNWPIVFRCIFKKITIPVFFTILQRESPD
jgi:hypothetical protein